VENITVSFSASPATDKVKSKTQMNTCETKIKKDRSLLVFSAFLQFSPVFSDRGNQASQHPIRKRFVPPRPVKPESGVQLSG
jgi:hypothetical protein